MKKKLLIIFVMIGILFPSLVSAQTYFKITNNYNSDYSTGPEVRDYTSVIDGMTSMVYCLDPGLHWYGAGKDYKVLRTVNPETPGGNQKYDIALTYAYQRLLQLGYTSRNTFNRVVGTTLFRLLQMHFQPRGDVLYDGAYNYYKNNGVNLKQTEAVRSARAIYTEAIGLAYSGRSYEDLIKNGFIVDDGSGNGGLWGPQWTSETKTVEYSKEPTTGGDVINYTFSVMPVEASKTPEYYKEYTSLMKISCSNTTVKCSFDANQTPDLGPAGVLVTLVVDVSKWDRKDMGITLDLSYCDARSSYQLVILERADGSKVQQMLAPLPSSSCTATPAQLSRQNNVPHSSISIATPLTDSCLCNTSTGVYEYTDKNGNKTTCDPAKEDCTEFKNGKTCPGTCEKNKSCSKENDKYYCKNGQECNADEYQKDCEDVILEETCKKLEDACDKNPNGPECDEFNQKCLHPACTHPTNNEYYCNDGKPCSSDEYQKDCEEPKLEETCKKLEDACDKNPNGPECDEFNQKCVDCNPTVSIPSDCADITDDPDDYLSKSGLKGSISDINKDELSSCNKYANQVKACVIGKNDSTGASFEDTTDKNKGAVSSGQSENRYCSVWCEETYDFTLPSAVRTQSGGYFTLSMKINGTRNCYTSGSKDKATPINKEQFEKDLEAKQQEVIDAYNEYLFNLEGVKYYEEYLSTLNEQGDYDILKENNRINNIYYVKKSSDSSCNGRDCTNHEDGDSFPDNFPEDCDDVYIYRYQFTATQYTLRKVNGQLVLSKSSSRSFVPGTERKNEAIKDGDEDYDDSELHDSTSVYGLSNDCSCG